MKLFWLFMLVIVLLIPAIMLIFGFRFKKAAPASINMLFGYRTTRSMRNRETWDFAHNYCGRLWIKLGAVLAPISVIPMLFLYGASEESIGYCGIAVEVTQTAVLLVSIALVEAALKRNFDDIGRRKS